MSSLSVLFLLTVSTDSLHQPWRQLRNFMNFFLSTSQYCWVIFLSECCMRNAYDHSYACMSHDPWNLEAKQIVPSNDSTNTPFLCKFYLHVNSIILYGILLSTWANFYFSIQNSHICHHSCQLYLYTHFAQLLLQCRTAQRCISSFVHTKAFCGIEAQASQLSTQSGMH